MRGHKEGCKCKRCGGKKEDKRIVVTIRLPQSLIARIDERRGAQTLTSFIQDAVEEAVEYDEEIPIDLSRHDVFASGEIPGLVGIAPKKEEEKADVYAGVKRGEKTPWKKEGDVERNVIQTPAKEKKKSASAARATTSQEKSASRVLRPQGTYTGEIRDWRPGEAEYEGGPCHEYSKYDEKLGCWVDDLYGISKAEWEAVPLEDRCEDGVKVHCETLLAEQVQKIRNRRVLQEQLREEAERGRQSMADAAARKAESDRLRAEAAARGECLVCGGDQALQPCRECGGSITKQAFKFE